MTTAWRLGLAATLIVWLGCLFVFLPYPKTASDLLLPVGLLQGNTPVTIAFMGTSLTSGNPWPDFVTDRLQDCTHRPVRALRFAQGGATSVWGLTQVEAVILAMPDLVLLEFAINDADLRRGLSLVDSRETHRAILVRLKQGLPKAQIVLMTTNPPRGLRRLLRPRLPDYFAAYHQLAADHDTGLIDLAPRWLAVPRMTQALPDGLHPTPAATLTVVVPVATGYLGRLLGRVCQT